jgi:hypothetical protein
LGWTLSAVTAEMIADIVKGAAAQPGAVHALHPRAA